MNEPEAVFHIDGDVVEPTVAALGPWNPNALHGGAVGALLARSLEVDGYLLGRITIDILGRVPRQALRLDLTPEWGWGRLRRQTVELWAGERLVGRAQALRLPDAEVDLPKAALPVRSLPNPEEGTSLTAAQREATAAAVGHENFASHAVEVQFIDGDFSGSGPTTVWTRFVLPLVAGEELTGTQRAVAAADLANAGNGALDFGTWSFANADLTVQLTREPVGEWMGVASKMMAQVTGVGAGDALLHDIDGPIGRSSQTLVIEPR